MSKFARKPETEGIGPKLDGHEFHYAWAARLCLNLLNAETNTLVAVGIEGFTPQETGINKDADDIADVVKLYGAADIKTATKVEISQLKYAPVNADSPLKASDLSKTLTKFKSAQAGLSKAHGVSWCNETLFFEFISNRPIGTNLSLAIKFLQSEALELPDSSHIKTQVSTLEKAIDLDRAGIRGFLQRLSINGRGETLQSTRSDTSRVLATWSGVNDMASRLRFLELIQVIRSKAGYELNQGQGKLIKQIDVLGALNIEWCDLFPVEHSFVTPNDVLPRDIVPNIIAQAKNGDMPIVVHGPGGVGKTVIMQGIADALASYDTYVLFDGYGRGRWRIPSDQRHKASKSIPQIVNMLSRQGLCDPILPPIEDARAIEIARTRFQQAIISLKMHQKNAELFILLDAVGHSGERAQSEGVFSFVQALIETLHLDPIPSVNLIVSCRTERKHLVTRPGSAIEITIPVFSSGECETLVKLREPNATNLELKSLTTRCQGNPRILDVLLTQGRPFEYEGALPADTRAIEDQLESLIARRFDDAIQLGVKRGHAEKEMRELFHMLSLLPPPVPSEDLASFLGLNNAAVESFVSDVFPLIEPTVNGIMFRDEPTETYARKEAKKNIDYLRDVIRILRSKQMESYYAVRALPNILAEFNLKDELVDLAFSEVFPTTANNSSAIRQIQQSRVGAAIKCVSRHVAPDLLFNLLLKASLIAGGNEKAEGFVEDYPDLVALTNVTETKELLLNRKSDWAGARNASLALYYWLSVERRNADLHCGYAIEWLNWDLKNEHRHNDEAWGHALYVLIQLGKARKVIDWLNRRSPNIAFSFIKNMLHLSKRDPSIDIKAFKVQLLDIACAKGADYPWLIVGLLNVFTFTSGDRKRLFTSLAQSESAPKRERASRHQSDDTFIYERAILNAAALATHSGHRENAKIILNFAEVTRPNFYVYTSHSYRQEDLYNWLIYSGTLAACERRRVSMRELYPVELWKQVPMSIRSRGPKAIDRKISGLIAKSNIKLSKQARPVFTDENQRDLDQRCAPLVAFIENIRMMLTNPNQRSFSQQCTDLLNKVKATTSYPYHDQKSYLTVSGYRSFISLGVFLGIPDDACASIISDGLIVEMPSNLKIQLYLLEEFVGSAQTGKGFTSLYQHIRTQTLRDQYIDNRLEGLARLAKIVSQHSVSEGRELVNLAMSQCDQIGSEGYDFADALLSVTSRYSGEVLSQQSAHDFCRIIEASLPEEPEKFMWNDVGASLSNLIGLPGLAWLSRMADNEKISLEFTLSAAFNALIKAKKITPLSAANLFGIAEHADTWRVGIERLVENIVQKLNGSEKEVFLQNLMVELDRRESRGISPYTAETLHKTLLPLKVNPAILMRLSSFMPTENSNKDTSTKRELALDDLPEALKTPLDFTDFESLDFGLNSLGDGGNKSVHTHFHISDYLSKLDNIDAAISATCAIGKSEVVRVRSKVECLETISEKWSSQSLGVKSSLSKMAIHIAHAHGLGVLDNRWGKSSTLEKLVKFSELTPSVYASKLLHSDSIDIWCIGSADWLRLAGIVQVDVNAKSAKHGLGNYLRLTAELLPSEVTEPVWNDDYLVPENETEVVAGFIWNQLGSPHTALRWRGMHALLRLTASGQVEILNSVILRFTRETAVPFSVPNLPFYHLHAKLWLLIALARISVENPEIIEAHTEFFKDVFVHLPDHMIMHYYAHFALRNIAEHLNDAPLKVVVQNLEHHLKPIGTTIITKGMPRRLNHYGGHPTSHKNKTATFNFGYDFDKEVLNKLGEVFGVDTWKVEDDTAKIVKVMDASVASMYECPRGIRSEGEHYESESQSYGLYLSLHAVWLLAGQYKKVKNCVASTYTPYPLSEWLSAYEFPFKNGLLRADSTDLYPANIIIPEIEIHESSKTTSYAERTQLIGICGLENNTPIPETFLAFGHWNYGGGLSIDISSALVPTGKARDATQAQVLVPNTYSYLPSEVDHHDERAKQGVYAAYIPWVNNSDRWYQGLDRFDPYGHPHAFNRPRPHPATIKAFSLKKDDDLGRVWKNADGMEAFMTRNWGTETGHGQHRTSNNGHTLHANANFLKSVLEAKGYELVLKVTLTRYFKDAGRDNVFVYKSALARINSKGCCKLVWQIPANVRAAVNKLTAHEQSYFENCYRAVRQENNL